MSRGAARRRHGMRLALWVGLGAVLLVFLGRGCTIREGAAGVPPLGVLLDPWDGLYRTARQAEHPAAQEVALPGLDGPVVVERDRRGVPHLFAESDRDAVRALGYVVAQDRLFQLDFLPRVAAGRLAEVFGEGSLATDRYLRRTGMALGAARNLERIQAEGGIEWDLVRWYAEGVNAYLAGLDPADLPFEFRLLGYRPARFRPLDAILLMQYFAYDLTYRSSDSDYATLREALGVAEFERLYPLHSPLSVPIIPEPGGVPADASTRPVLGASPAGVAGAGVAGALAYRHLAAALAGTFAEGFRDGKGSNNWAVGPSRSATGAPILAGDMHLSLTLPAIWYEVHLVTPTMNVYGVTTPGSPLPIEAFNDHVGWAYTNTGADVVDHYRLELDATGRRYRYDGAWRPLEARADTIHVRGGAPQPDTLWLSHWGPLVEKGEGEAVAVRWTAHEPSRNLAALWGMNRARGYDDFQAALRLWDTPMQNILYADRAGNIAIRSTGYLPVRASGRADGLLDGSTDAAAWVGRVPFDELPHAWNPAQGFLSSTNQQPADSTYLYYLGHDWRSTYRSLRIDSLLRGQDRHSVDDLKRYQADVHVVQRDLFVPLLDTLGGLSPRADSLRGWLQAWDGAAGVDAFEPLLLDEWLGVLDALAWDEAVFEGRRRPGQAVLYRLLREAPASPWLDVQGTPAVEDASALLRRALEQTVDTLALAYGWGTSRWRWGDHHHIVFRHLTQSAALRPLWRGPLPFPGFESTLSPAGGRTTTHSASWRVVVDFSGARPQGYGVYPGGQSGNPFSDLYDEHIAAYVGFQHYVLERPTQPGALDARRVASRLVLRPPS